MGGDATVTQRLGGRLRLLGGGGCIGVNQVDEGLGQPRQVTTAGMHGPSGRLIFDM
jgi:hypothetical protein